MKRSIITFLTIDYANLCCAIHATALTLVDNIKITMQWLIVNEKVYVILWAVVPPLVVTLYTLHSVMWSNICHYYYEPNWIYGIFLTNREMLILSIVATIS